MLLDLAVILIAAKLAAELCERVSVPAVVGEIVVGILIGPSVLGWIPADSEPIVALAELGVLLLLVQVGMEMDLAELGRVGRASMAVAVIGVAVPFVLGGAVALGFGETGNTALFIGAALTATSVGITARVFGDLRALATTEARVVLGAAVADDVLGLIILTVVVKIVTGGDVDAVSILATIGGAVGFLDRRHGGWSRRRPDRVPDDRTVVAVVGDDRRGRPGVRPGVLVGGLVGQPGADHRRLRRRPGDRPQRPARPRRARVRRGRQRADPRVLRADRSRRRPRRDGPTGRTRPRRGAC